MAQVNGTTKARSQRSQLVQATAAKMRDLILAQAPDTQIGSLPDMARLLEVGIVTVQQAARILEHEGLLEVRRGPGGGYYGTRPDDAAFERSMAAYLRVHGSRYNEALEMITLLECELIVAATYCADEALRGALRVLADSIDHCEEPEQRVDFEARLHAVLFRMVERPLIELLARVTMRHYETNPVPPVFLGEEGKAAWKAWRHRIIYAILERDEELARFEATRHRRQLLQRLKIYAPAGEPGPPALNQS